MAERLGHIALNREATFKRRKQKGHPYAPYKKVERDYDEFRRGAAQRLLELDRGRRDIAERYAKYGYTPAPIFLLGLTQNVPYAGFKDRLESVGIETVSARTERPDCWAVSGGRDHAGRLDRQIERRAASGKATFIDAIGAIDEADPAEKIGRSLRRRPINDDFELADVEVWRLGDGALESFTGQLLKMVMDNGGRITDTHKTRDAFVVQISCNAALLSMVAAMREVIRIDRPMQVEMEDLANSRDREVRVAGAPGPDAPGILVADSGVAMHPAIEPAFGGLVAAGGGGGGGDETGHGTGVAGIALYGDVKKCIDSGGFKPEIWIYVAKVLEKDPGGDTVFAPLMETRIERAVEETARMHPRCRVVNLSLGDASRRMEPGARQHRLGGLVDAMSTAHPGMMFTISAGSNRENMDHVGPYPDYLLSDAEELRLMDPAASAHAITVGALSRQLVGVDHPHYPSPDTCTGPGLNCMVKPEVVEAGGGYHGPGSLDVVTLNANFASDGRPFTTDRGTSMSAPAVAHMLAMLQAQRQEASRNLLKALVISSARVPAGRPGPLGRQPRGGRPDRAGLLRIYGYGRPDLDEAMYSRSGRALFVYDGKMRLDEVALFAVYVPDSFWGEKGLKTVEVTLAYDPPTDSRAGEYFGTSMEYHLYKNVGLDTVRMCYEDLGKQGGKAPPTPASIKGSQLDLYPGVNQRKRSLHQKSSYSSKRPNIGTEEPLVLAVVSMNKWIKAKDYEQGFALAVALSHSKDMDIYAALRSVNAARVRGGA